jgi:hypothetical protein
VPHSGAAQQRVELLELPRRRRQQQRSHAGWCRLPTLRVDEQDECVVIAKLSMLI